MKYINKISIFLYKILKKFYLFLKINNKLNLNKNLYFEKF